MEQNIWEETSRYRKPWERNSTKRMDLEKALRGVDSNRVDSRETVEIRVASNKEMAVRGMKDLLPVLTTLSLRLFMWVDFHMVQHNNRLLIISVR